MYGQKFSLSQARRKGGSAKACDATRSSGETAARRRRAARLTSEGKGERLEFESFRFGLRMALIQAL